MVQTDHDRPRLLVQLSHGFIVRNFLYTDLARRLGERFELVFLAPRESVPPLARMLGAGGRAVPFEPKPRALEGLLGFIRRFVMVNPRRARAISIFSLEFKAKRPRLYPVLKLANRLLGSVPMLRRLWVMGEQAILPLTEALALMEEWRPAALLTSNYGTEPDTMRLIVAARRRGVPSIAIVPSWDNLSSKGVIGAKPDHLLVWNELMREEAIALHDFAPGQISVCGPLQFDLYAEARRMPRERVCRRLGLDPARPVIVYGTITPRFFRYNAQIVRHLAEAIEAGDIDPRAQILVRLHPQVVKDGVFGERVDSYEELERRHASVKLNVPEVLDWGPLVPAREDDPELLAGLLDLAAVCIVPGSTLALDALAAGCPAIGLAYDGDEPQPYEGSIRRWYDYDYFLPLMKTGALPLAGSRAELVLQVQAFLKDRTRLAGARAAAVALEIGAHDGRAAERAAARIALLAGHALGSGELQPAPAAMRRRAGGKAGA